MIPVSRRGFFSLVLGALAAPFLPKTLREPIYGPSPLFWVLTRKQTEEFRKEWIKQWNLHGYHPIVFSSTSGGPTYPLWTPESKEGYSQVRAHSPIAAKQSLSPKETPLKIGITNDEGPYLD